MSHPHNHWADRVAILAAEYCATIRRKLHSLFEAPRRKNSDAGPDQGAAEVQVIQAKCETIRKAPVDPTSCVESPHEALGHSGEWAYGLTKSQAEDLLDWLERQGSPGQVEIDANQSFAVYCPHFRVEQDTKGQLVICRQSVPERT